MSKKNILLFSLVLLSTLLNSQNSGSWTLSASATWSTSAGGVGITATATSYGSTLNNFQTSDMMACSGAYSDSSIFENPSLSIRHTFPNEAFLTFTFDQEVKDPVMHFDRIGGVSSSGNATSSVVTIVTPGVIFEELSQNDTHFVTTTNTVTRVSGVNVPGSGFECGSPTGGTAAGSVQLKGVFTSVSFEISMNPDESATSSDRFEIAFSNVVAHDSCTDGASVNGVPTVSDRDGDGVNDICDQDDDNDGILDIDELCPVVPGAASPDGNEVKWSLNGFDVFTIGNNTNGLGYQESGFQQAAYNQGKSLTVLDNVDDFSVSGNSGDGSAINSTVTFVNGTMRYVTNHPVNNRAEFRETTSGGFTSGATGTDGVYIEPELGLEVGDYYSIEIDFTTPVTAFSLDIVDAFDTFTSGSPMLSYQIFADGNLIAYLQGNTVGDDVTGSVSVYDAKGNLKGTHMVGQNIESAIGFVSLTSVSQVVVRHDVVEGSISSSSHDPHGLDALVFSTDFCDSDSDGVPNHQDTDSDDDGCPDAIEGAGNIIDNLSTLPNGSPTVDSSSQNLGTTSETATGKPLVNSVAYMQDNTSAVITASDKTACTIDLNLVKTVDNALPKVGANIIYELTVTNSGPLNATDVVVSDVLPTGLTYVSSNAASGTTYNNISGNWTINSLLNGASVTLQITATIAQAGVIVNTAQVSQSTQNDIDSEPDSDD